MPVAWKEIRNESSALKRGTMFLLYILPALVVLPILSVVWLVGKCIPTKGVSDAS